MTELKTIPPLSPDERAKIDAQDKDPPIALCGECGLKILKSTVRCTCSSKYCPVFPRKS